MISKPKPLITFFLPVFNKEQTIAETIESILHAANQLNISIEIVAIDDQSTDTSWKILSKIKARVPSLKIAQNSKNMGFAKTYYQCINMAEGQFGLCLSTDNDIAVTEIFKVLSAVETSPVIVQTFSNFKSRSFSRYFLSLLFTLIMNILSGNRLTYYNGCNVYPMEFLKNNPSAEQSFAFQADILINAIATYKYTTVTITGKFQDNHSSAVAIKNILAVLTYFAKFWWRKTLWTR